MANMSTSIGSKEAARLLGVTTATLYAYVSRGFLTRSVAVDGRTSLYERQEIEQLAARSRRREPLERPSIDVQISTAVTRLDDRGPLIRGHALLELATTHSFEQVAELLLSGRLGEPGAVWPCDRDELARSRSIIDAASPIEPLTAMSLAAGAMAADFAPTEAAHAGRRLLGVIPSLFGGPQRGDIATRLARAWTRRPSPELVAAISRALVLLADHGLATSTLAVRVAASVRTAPASAIACGLDVVAGPYHGLASRAAATLFEDAADRGADRVIAERSDAGRRLPGFGHSVYRNGDPRFEPLLDTVMALPGDASRRTVVDEVLTEAGRTIGHLPNIDLALGALSFLGGLPVDAPLFAIARIPGWVAHYEEELDERPVRFRGLAKER